MDEKRKKKLEEASQSGSTGTVIDPPSPIRRHVKWKMARTMKTRQMTSEAAKEIADKIDSLENQASQGSFVAHGHQDVLTTVIGRPKHPGHVCAIGAVSQSRTSCTSSSMAPEDLEQLTQQIKEKSDSIANVILQPDAILGLALPPEPEVGPSAACVNTKESCVDPSGNDPDMGNSDKCGLYIDENPPRLVALGRVYEGSIIVHKIPLLHDQVKVCVVEVRDAGQTLNTFLAWLTHMIKRLSEQGVVGSAKPADRSDHEVDDPLYLMTLTIPQLFLKPLQVMWDAIVFGVFNEDFPLYKSMKICLK
ncbi:hypothetical protein GmHk_13G036538 [Glycine max]|nr:hypothetical protein GmHk_13G036538 [Glycine max]